MYFASSQERKRKGIVSDDRVINLDGREEQERSV
jgi:hypothetical protein